jgi:peptidoglycan L-alanyl-D-glutamate endopeptidase CwlK
MPILGEVSLRNLAGVNPKLRLLCKEVIEESPVDFRVTEGLRTLSRQKHLVSIGASQTLDSRHLTGDAVDLVPWDGGPRWEWSLIYTLAAHIRTVANSNSISLRWGGAWDVYNFTYTVKPIPELVDGYITRQKAKGRRPFLDGPHFELCRKEK